MTHPLWLGRGEQMLWRALRSLCYGTGFVTLWGWLALETRALDVRWTLSLPEWTVVPGLVLTTLGACLALSCVALFVVRGRGTPAPFDAPREFVAVGPYDYVRNPMYVGGLAVLAGLALSMRSPSMLAFAAIFAAWAHLFVVLFEERWLRGKFGAAYEKYVSTVPRWLPRPRSYRDTVTAAGSSS